MKTANMALCGLVDMGNFNMSLIRSAVGFLLSTAQSQYKSIITSAVNCSAEAQYTIQYFLWVLHSSGTTLLERLLGLYARIIPLIFYLCYYTTKVPSKNWTINP